jgi:uncharacterized RDD family membrane protein YckC
MSEAPIEGEAPDVKFAGFWRRIGAAILDTILLGVVGWAAGLLFYNRLVEYGSEGRLIGIPFSLVYFGLFNSRLYGGTPGKQAFGIRVVGRDGLRISILLSIWRAAVFLIPFYLNGVDLSFLQLGQTLMIFSLTVVAFLVFGVGGSTIYLYLANWKTRQVIHDLAAGTFVVTKASIERPIKSTINPRHHIVIAVLFLVSLAVVPLSERFLGSDWQFQGTIFGVDFGSLTKIQSAVIADPHVLSASVNVSTAYAGSLNGPSSVNTFLNVIVQHRGVPSNSEAFASGIANRVLKVAPDALGRQKLSITVRYGFDIGIASNWSNMKYVYTPAEWRARSSETTTQKHSN